MIEQYLQFAIQFIEEIWLQLNTMFGLEETQAFKFLKPYLLQVQDNPTYMGIAIALMALLPYSLYKIISIPRKRRNKLNERENELDDRENKLSEHENELEQKLIQREMKCNGRERKLKKREKNVQERENKLNERENKFNERENKFNELMDEMEDEEEDEEENEEIDINDPRVIGKGDYDQAIAYFEEENYKEAASWFSKAAEQGHTESQYRLGEMYLNGEGVVQSDMEAIKWYKKAAEQGHAKAQKDLNYYWTFEEETTQENDNESKGGADAQCTLDDMYRIAKKDYDQAVASSKKGKYMEAFLFYKNAAEHGYAKAQLELGSLYYQGQGVTQSDTEAVKWYRKAAEQGHAKAQLELGSRYYYPKLSASSGLVQSYKEAVTFFRKAAEQGDSEAQNCLGVMYAKGEGVVQSDTEAAKWNKKAAEQGLATAQCNLGSKYQKGEGVVQSDTEAFKWYKKAAEQGNAIAQRCLGTKYSQGKGVVQSDTEALKWLQKAAEQGDSEAQKQFDELSDLLEKEASAVKEMNEVLAIAEDVLYDYDEVWDIIEKKAIVRSDQQDQLKFDKEKALCNFVEKTNHTEHIFADIINDLNDAIKVSVNDWPPLTLMAYGYTHRLAAAALYVQGLMTKNKYLKVKDFFNRLQIKTGRTVAFQEQATFESMKFLAEYNKALTRSMLQTIVAVAESCEIPPGESVSDDELLIRIKDVTETVTSKHGHTKVQEDDDIDVITRAVLETIPNEEIAYQFVLEEIEGASGGNEEAKKFAKDSVFLRDEYEGAMRGSSPEVDGYSGPQQTLTRLTLGRLAGNSMDEMARVRIGVVKNVIKHWKLDEQS